MTFCDLFDNSIIVFILSYFRAFSFRTRRQRNLTIFLERSGWKTWKVPNNSRYTTVFHETEYRYNATKGNGIPQKRANKNLHFTETLNTCALRIHSLPISTIWSLLCSSFISSLYRVLRFVLYLFEHAYKTWHRPNPVHDTSDRERERKEIEFLSVPVLDDSRSYMVVKKDTRSLIEKSLEIELPVYIKCFTVGMITVSATEFLIGPCRRSLGEHECRQRCWFELIRQSPVTCPY